MILLLSIFAAFFAIYILLESLDAIRRMCAGIRLFCHKSKYVGAMACAAWTIYPAVLLEITAFHILLLGTIALFIWPRTIWRLRRCDWFWEIEFRLRHFKR